MTARAACSSTQATRNRCSSPGAGRREDGALPEAGRATFPIAVGVALPVAGRVALPVARTVTLPVAGTVTPRVVGRVTLTVAGRETVPMAGRWALPVAGRVTVPMTGRVALPMAEGTAPRVGEGVTGGMGVGACGLRTYENNREDWLVISLYQADGVEVRESGAISRLGFGPDSGRHRRSCRRRAGPTGRTRRRAEKANGMSGVFRLISEHTPESTGEGNVVKDMHSVSCCEEAHAGVAGRPRPCGPAIGPRRPRQGKPARSAGGNRLGFAFLAG